MWTIISNFRWILLLLFGATHVVFPLIIYATFRLKHPTTVLPLDLDESDLPDDITDFMIPASRELEEMGFHQVGCFGLPDMCPDVVSCNLLLVNTTTNEAAMVSSVCGTEISTGLKTKYVEFLTRFSDDSCVQTNNSRELGGFCELPSVRTIKFWDVPDVRKLYQLHTYIAARLRSGDPRLTLYEKFDGDLEAYVIQCVIGEPCDYQTKIGILRVVDGGYAPTLFGAFVLVWKELFRYKNIRRWAAWRESRRWLQQFQSRADNRGTISGR